MQGKLGYLTLMGRSGWAVLNSFHAVLLETEYRPDTIFLLYETQLKDAIKPIIQGLELLQRTYTKTNVKALEVPTWDAGCAGKTALETLNALRAIESEIALDITGGRKALVAGTLLGLKGQGIDLVFYLGFVYPEIDPKAFLSQEVGKCGSPAPRSHYANLGRCDVDMRIH